MAVGLLLTATINYQSASAQTWTQTIAPTNVNWFSVASSADGSTLAALAGPNQIWISTNFGTSWTSNTVVFTGFGAWEHASLVSSADGFKLVAGVGVVNGPAPSPLVVGSTNFGNWSLLVLNPPFIASSANGTKLVAAKPNAWIVSSTNSGLTWAPLTAAPVDSSSVAMSADGTKLVVTASLIYTSTDSGSTWVTNDVPAESWRCLASSADGITLAAVAGGLICISTNSGNNWASNSVLNENWSSVAMSADGSKIVAVSAGNGIYTSADSGNTWTSNNVANPEWISVASSADGNKLVAAAYNFGGGIGGIWTLQTPPTPQLNAALSDTNVVFSWIVPSTNFVLQENSDLTTTDWLTLTNTPTLNLSNLNDEVVLSPSNSSGFFRLVAQ